MIAESMDLLWGQTSTLKPHGLSVEEGGGNGSERVAGRIDHGDRRVVREGAQTIAGLRRCESPSKRLMVSAANIEFNGVRSNEFEASFDCLLAVNGYMCFEPGTI